MTDFTVIAPEIARDRWQRPLVVPPTGGSAVPYTRCTTFVDAVESHYNLARWQQRMVAIGLADRPDLLLSVAAHRDNKEKLNGLCEQALEAAKGHAAATIGTSLHSLTEQLDRGLELGPVPEAYAADLEAYKVATAELVATHIEQFCVQDHLLVGGTPDRVVKFRGQRYIADLKTGDIKYGYVKIAAQLAMYARSRTYDVATGERGMHNADLERGIVIHLPAGTGECRLYWVDLKAGWEACRIARDVRNAQKQRLVDLFADVEAEVLPTAARSPQQPSLEALISMTNTREELEALWAIHADKWTDELTAAAKRHVEDLASRDQSRQGATA